MSEALILAVVQGIVDLLTSLENQPSQSQIDAAVRAAIVKAADLEIQTEYPNQAP